MVCRLLHFCFESVGWQHKEGDAFGFELDEFMKPANLMCNFGMMSGTRGDH